MAIRLAGSARTADASPITADCTALHLVRGGINSEHCHRRPVRDTRCRRIELIQGIRDQLNSVGAWGISEDDGNVRWHDFVLFGGSKNAAAVLIESPEGCGLCHEHC